jgi:hypothetical protein
LIIFGKNKIMKQLLICALILCFGAMNAQSNVEKFSLFINKSLPYIAPSDYYSDMYLEEGEESSIPFKEISKDFYVQIGGYDNCRCTVYAVDQISLSNGYIGLVVYEIAIVESMPYEQNSYVLYIVDAQGKPTDNIRLSTSFYTSDGGDRMYSEEVSSEIFPSEMDAKQLVIKKVLTSGESISGEFGQNVTRTSSNFYKINNDGRLEDVTVWVEEY